jgi:hypothetical protein
LPEYFTTEDLLEAAKKIKPLEGFAEGGLVSDEGYDSQRVNDLVAELEQELYA